MDYLEQIAGSSSMEEIWRLHCDRMACFGFDRLLYGFTRFRTDTGLGNPEDFLIMSNHPGDYAERFVKDGMYFHAPMVHWALRNSGACSWAWLSKTPEALTASERKVVAFNAAHRVIAGYSISFADASIRNKGAIALTARPGMSQDEADAVFEAHGRSIIIMNNMVHLKLIQLPYSGWPRQLTQRQREALEWMRDGKTVQDAARLMGLTPATVEKHLRLAREVLDVATTAQAVLKASLQNQIFVLKR